MMGGTKHLLWLASLCHLSALTPAIAEPSKTLVTSLFFCEDPTFSYAQRLAGFSDEGWVEIPIEKREKATESYANFETVVMHAVLNETAGSKFIYDQSLATVTNASKLLSGTYARNAWFSRPAQDVEEYLRVTFNGSGDGGGTICTFALANDIEMIELATRGRLGDHIRQHQSDPGSTEIFGARSVDEQTLIVTIDSAFFSSAFATTPIHTVFLQTPEAMTQPD